MTKYDKIITNIEQKTIDKSFVWIPLSSSKSNGFFNPHNSDEKYKNYELDHLNSYMCEYNEGYFLLLTFTIKASFPSSVSTLNQLFNPPNLLLSYVEKMNRDYEIISSDDETLLKLRKLVELNNNFTSNILKKLEELSDS